MRFQYGRSFAAVERPLAFLCALLVAGAVTFTPAAAQAPLKMVVLGDSLSAGLGLTGPQAYPAKLQKALQDKGIAVEMINAGVSGDTSSGGLDRLDWSIPEGTQAVIVELGANDALRGLDPKLTRRALEQIVTKLKARNIAVLLAGMLAPPNNGPQYAKSFNAIYPDLAKQFDVALYPFFLDGVAGNDKLNQADGIHPTAQGVDIMVIKSLPAVEAWLRPLLGQKS
jgi:acyl-CoA thioesterase-1